MLKKYIYGLLSISISLTAIYFISCRDNVGNPIREPSGLTGLIIDSIGIPIHGASIYCLYYSSYIPGEPDRLTTINAQASQDTVFDFQLYQNFPNPFSNSTFIRFSLPQECQIILELSSKANASVRYRHMDTKLYGLHQFYIENLVDSLNLENGIYEYSLKAEGIDGTQYSGQREMFIISDLGEPNAESDVSGNYFFDYNMAFVSDTITINPNGNENYMYKRTLNNRVNLLFKKDGHALTIIEVTLYPDIVLTHDVVLTEE